MTPDEFRRHGHALIDWIADYRALVSSRPVMEPSAPGAVTRALPAAPPEDPEPFEHVLRDLDVIVMPGLLHWTHPRFFGYFPSNGDLAGVLGDYASTGLGVLGLAWRSSPALTEVETVTLDWLRQLLGLTDGWSGTIQDSASTSSLIALLSARERTTDYAMRRGGLQAEASPLVVYLTAHAHTSIRKAARLAGIGEASIVTVDHDGDGAMRPEALEAALARDHAAGRRPMAIVATVGTTVATATDPVARIAELAERSGAWLHVDAAMAGSAMLLPECRWMWAGIERADSLVVNPHKWLGAPFDCSTYYVRDVAHLARVMSTTASYLATPEDDAVTALRDRGVPLGRRFRALKLWFLLRAEGASGLRARLRRDLANAAWFEGEVRRRPGWRVVNRVILQTVCVRHEPEGLDERAVDAHTRAWVERVNQSGVAYLTPADIDGRWVARVSVGTLTTEREHVAQAWAAMQREAERIGPADA